MVLSNRKCCFGLFWVCFGLFWVVLGLFWVDLGYFELFWILFGKVLIFLEKKIFTVYFVRWYVVLRNRKYDVLGCFGLFWVVLGN